MQNDVEGNSDASPRVAESKVATFHAKLVGQVVGLSLVTTAAARLADAHFAKCRLSRKRRLNDAVQWVQRQRFTSMCVCICACRFDRSAKARWQVAQTKGFSPVCVRS